ncbi:PucR family transcriptional regulator [Cohnella lubricantis]|uniref:Helix-turn-helix domain-containing protein n=1 Tax=Cohnella lubricantis TaxID=2163172 RepID=A0A841TAL6_9BACL|nr:PucR family transcriptional regulator [Cohnella lubricantis]MBB6676438.1 helix-turn-helix domain-containing protein [Cohnella lubricantis]MBP2117555.1 purine catabolism regulator [Cohnella lubricantis]
MVAMPKKDLLSGSRTEQSSVTVKAMMELPVFGKAKLAAGEKGIHSFVAGALAMESPEAALRVMPGDVPIASEAMLREEQDRFPRLIADLARRGASALGILASGHERELPSVWLAEADALGVPLIALPPGLASGEVVRAVADRVLIQESALLAELQSRVYRMSRVLLDGGGLYPLLDAIEQEVGNPVALVRDQEKPWMSIGLRGDDTPQTWPFVQSLAFRQAGRGVAGGLVMLANSIRGYVCPLQGRDAKPAVFVVVERNRPLAPLDMFSAERLSVLAGLELANAEAVRDVEEKYLDRFLQDWLSGRIASASDWRQRANVCGCPLPEQAPVCAAVVGGADGSALNEEKLQEQVRKVREDRMKLPEGVLAASIDGELALIVPLLQAEAIDKPSDAWTNEMLQKLLGALRMMMDDPGLRLFAGRTADRPALLPSSLSQARCARQVAKMCGLSGEAMTYDRLGVYSLLYLIPSCEERDQFLLRFAAPLQQADKRGGGRLAETLEMFFRCNGNIKLTSERLYAHYNTVVYRLDKIQSILGISLDDPEDRLQLQLSLKLGQITPASEHSS